MLRLDLAAATFSELSGLGQDRAEPARETAHLQRKAEIVDRARLYGLDGALYGRRLGHEHDGKPDTHTSESIDQDPCGCCGIVGSKDDPFFRRPLEQLAQIRIDLGMMTKRKGDSCLFGSGAAIAPDNMKSGSFHLGHLPPTFGSHHKALPSRSYFRWNARVIRWVP